MDDPPLDSSASSSGRALAASLVADINPVDMWGQENAKTEFFQAVRGVLSARADANKKLLRTPLVLLSLLQYAMMFLVLFALLV